MGFKLTQRVIREFRPLFAHPKRGAVRDPLIEAILIHFADRTEQRREGSENPVRESGSTISKLGIADQTGLSLSVVEQRVKTLEEMGVLVVEQRLDKNIKQYAVDLSRLSEFNEKPFSSPPDGGVTPAAQAGNSIPVSRVTTYPSHGHNKTLVDPLLDPSSSLLSTTSSAEVESETEAQSARDNDNHHGDSEDRDGVGSDTITDDLRGYRLADDGTVIMPPQIPDTPSPELKAAWNGPAGPVDFSKLQTTTSGPASVTPGPPSTLGGQSPAEAPQGPENAAQPLQNPDPKAKRFGWQPSQAAYDHAKAICPDINLEIIITEYWMWCHDKKVAPSATHWMKWVTKAQRELEIERAEKRRAEALEQREQKPWYEKDLKF